jgi:hypothetical protein
MPFVDRIDKACCSMRVFLVGHHSWAGAEPPPEPGLELETIDGPASLSEALIALEERLGSAQLAEATLADGLPDVVAWARSAG